MKERSERKASAGMHFYSPAVSVFVLCVIFNECCLPHYKWTKNNILLNYTHYYSESLLKIVQEKKELCLVLAVNVTEQRGVSQNNVCDVSQSSVMSQNLCAPCRTL